LRQIGGAASPAAYFIFNVLSVLLFPLMLEGLGEAGLFAVHAGIMAAYFLFTFFVIPETKGLSLAQIETLFEADATEADGNRQPQSFPIRFLHEVGNLYSCCLEVIYIIFSRLYKLSKTNPTFTEVIWKELTTSI